MAWSTSSSPPSPPPPFVSKTRPEKYDVFLSFRGEDTRNSFTSHLHAALTRLKVRTYIDNELERGDDISPALVKAIEEAKVSVIVFSENYASSKWCLDEAMKITECKRTLGQVIVPVFYHLDPSRVRHQTGSYAVAFAKHEQRFKNDMEKILRWKLALVEAANVSGWDCMNRMESELVEEIALDVLQKLDAINSGGLESRIATYKQMAQVKLEKSLRTGSLTDMEDLAATLQTLAELKTEKAIRTDAASDWEELDTTYNRILTLKQEKFIRTMNLKDLQEITCLNQRLRHIQLERQNRMSGFYRGI
ncbi:hypothetical protein L6164_020718 [Bauhinia variegata]|uniref:Uncharacterized protein n=1 Tax=Bauhinia variegata TaxID=167791 RepID=A0ACB9MW68_BAUVA|nr:hypothetical protein L6164_020718 [Bauhinia variegata]